MKVLIPKDALIPCKKKEKETFSSFYPLQKLVCIKIFEGERIFTKNNHKLGEIVFNLGTFFIGNFFIDNSIIITLFIDSNLILHATNPRRI